MIALRKMYENDKDISGNSAALVYNVQSLGTEEAEAQAVPSESLDLCKCGAESTKGCHGVRDGTVYSEHFCDNCYNRE